MKVDVHTREGKRGKREDGRPLLGKKFCPHQTRRDGISSFVDREGEPTTAARSVAVSFTLPYLVPALHLGRNHHQLRARHLSVDPLDEDARADGVGHRLERGPLLGATQGSLLLQCTRVNGLIAGFLSSITCLAKVEASHLRTSSGTASDCSSLKSSSVSSLEGNASLACISRFALVFFAW